MPISLEYNPEKSILYCKAAGVVSLKEFQQALFRLINSEKTPPDVATLWDVSELDFSQFNIEFGEQLVAFREKMPQRGEAKIAIIAIDKHAFGMSRMYEMLSSNLPQKIMVFTTIDEAENWLQEI